MFGWGVTKFNRAHNAVMATLPMFIKHTQERLGSFSVDSNSPFVVGYITVFSFVLMPVTKQYSDWYSSVTDKIPHD